MTRIGDKEKELKLAVTLRTEIMGNLGGCGERHTAELSVGSTAQVVAVLRGVDQQWGKSKEGGDTH